MLSKRCREVTPRPRLLSCGRDTSNLLFTVAYEMLGSAADAEDVLQETWLRWVGVDLGTVRDRRAYLVRITTRQALNRLRTLGRRKESYVGPWLPEPLLTAPDVAARRPRDPVSPDQSRAAFEAFQRAIEPGDLQGLVDILAPDVVILSDGGGVTHAVPRPVVGADRVVRLLGAGLGQLRARGSVEPVQMNGFPALLVRLDGELDGVMSLRVEDGLISGLFYVRDPEKLSRVERETAVTR